MDLNLELLEKTGGFIKDELVKRTITLPNINTGEDIKADIYVKKLSYHSVVAETKNSGNYIATRIASSVFSKTGKPLFTVDQILGNDETVPGPLSAPLTDILLQAIAEVNDLGKTRKPQQSTQSENCGTNLSLQESAEKP